MDMSIRLVDFDEHAAQVANDLFYLLTGEAAGLYEEDGVTWQDAKAVIDAQPEGIALYGIIAREFDSHNMVTFGVLEIRSQEDFEAMQKEMNRLRASWKSQFGYDNEYCAAGAYAIAETGLL
jgi:hypothetical protein